MNKRWTVVKYRYNGTAYRPEFLHFDAKDQAEAAFEYLTETATPDTVQIDLFEEDLNWRGIAEVSVLLNREEYRYGDY